MQDKLGPQKFSTYVVAERKDEIIPTMLDFLSGIAHGSGLSTVAFREDEEVRG